MELLKEGDVIASTKTDRQGRYTFTQFPETGDYQVRVVLPAALTATTANPRDILIPTGDANLRGQDFGVRLANRVAAGALAQEFASILATLGVDDPGLPHPRR